MFPFHRADTKSISTSSPRRTRTMGRSRPVESRWLVKLANPDIAERERALMIALQADVADLGPAELRPCLELGRRHLRFPIRTPQFVLDGLEAVEPMFDVRSFGDDPREIPVANRFQVAGGRRVQAISGGGTGQTCFVVGGFRVVE